MGTMLRVQGIITRIMPHVDQGRVSRETTFDDLGPDSLERVEMVMAAEDEFGITIMEERAEDLRTVGDLVDLIEGELTRSAPTA